MKNNLCLNVLFGCAKESVQANHNNSYYTDYKIKFITYYLLLYGTALSCSRRL